MSRAYSIKVLVVFASLMFFSLAVFDSRAATPEYEVKYQEARTKYYSFRRNKEKQKFGHNWKNLAKLFEAIARNYPESQRAPDALFTAGKLYHDLYLISRVASDLEHSIKLYRQLAERYPSSHLADDAQLNVALKWVEFDKNVEEARKELSILVESFPDGDVTPKARRMLDDLGGKVKNKKQKRPNKPVAKSKPVLEKIRHWSNPDYTRISLYTRAKTHYKVGKLAADKINDKPPRLYVDLLEANPGSDLKSLIDVSDSVVERIRCASKDGGGTRVVIDLDETRQHRVFPMDDPARVVIDINIEDDPAAQIIGSKLAKEKVAQKETPKTKTAKPIKKIQKKESKKIAKVLKKKSRPGASLSMLAGLKLKKVVIDPGHGGKDPGAIGPKGTLEKDIALEIAKSLKEKLQKQLGLQVFLTRSNDRFIPLEERTAFANKRNADLFISVHCNAHSNRRFRGVETFYLDLTNDRYAIKLAARENATSEKSISDLRYILADLALKSNVDDSIMVSNFIQKGMVGSLRKKYNKVKNMGVKAALFYVLIGARMPSILVEASFISNHLEEKRLKSAAYREKLINGIVDGIKNFIEARERLLD
jgi:N-acetylmuramoyl-L-alanine amidase